MAIAAQTAAARQLLLAQLNIVAKELYKIESESYSIAQTGPGFDTKMATALAAIKAAGYTTPA